MLVAAPVVRFSSLSSARPPPPPTGACRVARRRVSSPSAIRGREPRPARSRSRALERPSPGAAPPPDPSVTRRRLPGAPRAHGRRNATMLIEDFTVKSPNVKYTDDFIESTYTCVTPASLPRDASTRPHPPARSRLRREIFASSSSSRPTDAPASSRIVPQVHEHQAHVRGCGQRPVEVDGGAHGDDLQLQGRPQGPEARVRRRVDARRGPHRARVGNRKKRPSLRREDPERCYSPRFLFSLFVLLPDLPPPLPPLLSAFRLFSSRKGSCWWGSVGTTARRSRAA